MDEVSRGAGEGATNARRPGLWVIYSPEPQIEGATVRLDRAGLLLGRETRLDGGRQLSSSWISERHAEVVAVRGSFVLTDLGSRNGTRLNGALIEGSVDLQLDDVIELGGTFLQLVADTLACSGLADDDAVERELVGPSPQLQRARTRIRQLAPLAVNVLISGPSGSGKERAASALHAASGRTGALCSLNCAVLTSEFAASELFGHVKGAFTGAASDRLGAFRQADGGTLFLDEISDLPLPLQAKLLRALQEQRVQPLGSDSEVGVDVRVVAATNRDLAALVREQRFRGDLFSRIAAAVVELPPLRERPADVVALAHHFLGGRRLHRLAVRELLQHDWPHNVRDLRTLVALIAAGDIDEPARLTDAARDKLGFDRRLTAGGPNAGPAGGRPEPVDEQSIVWPADEGPRTELLERLLAQYRGNIERIAGLLGKPTRSVRRWVKAYGLDADRYR